MVLVSTIGFYDRFLHLSSFSVSIQYESGRLKETLRKMKFSLIACGRIYAWGPVPSCPHHSVKVAVRSYQ